MVRRQLAQGVLLPSCGIALVTGLEKGPKLIPTCIDVALTHADPLVVPDDVTVDAYLQVLATGEPIVGEEVYYRIIEPLGGIIDSGLPLITDSGGHVNFAFTAIDPGLYRVKVVFLGQGVEKIGLEAAFLLCPGEVISCAERRSGEPCLDETYCLEHYAECCTMTFPPRGICCTGPPGGGIGGGLLPQTLRQPICGILCGQGLNQNVKGLEPE